MSLNSGLDIAIGLALMYLGLSVICTVVNKYIAQMLGWRAKTLAAGIKRLIDDPQLYRAFYHHGLIAQTKDASGTDTFVVTRSLWNDAGLRAQMAAAAPLVVQAYENSGSPDQLQQLQDTLRPLPLGWSRSLPHGLEWIAKVVGLLLTGLAVSLGAPFWFDLLSRFVRVRATGAKPVSKT